MINAARQVLLNPAMRQKYNDRLAKQYDEDDKVNAQQLVQSEPASQQPVKYCPSCGQQLNIDAKFCSGCGSSQDGKQHIDNASVETSELKLCGYICPKCCHVENHNTLSNWGKFLIFIFLITTFVYCNAITISLLVIIFIILCIVYGNPLKKHKCGQCGFKGIVTASSPEGQDLLNYLKINKPIESGLITNRLNELTQKESNEFGSVFSFIVVVFFIVFAIWWGTRDNTSYNNLESNVNAPLDCEKFVKKRLKSPSTVKSPLLSEISIQGSGNGPWVVNGFVDSQN